MRPTPQEVLEIRRLRGLKQTELAKMLGVSQATISYWESGRRCRLRRVNIERLEEVRRGEAAR
jgi:transcriptional regulator with XRE-family HTH domain